MRFITLIASILLLFGCTPDLERMEEPKDLIPKEKMVVLMTEMMKLEGHVSSKHVQLTKYYKIITKSGDSLLKVHGCTPQQFENSMDYYAFQQKPLKEIYIKVLDNLNKEMADLERSQKSVIAPEEDDQPTLDNPE